MPAISGDDDDVNSSAADAVLLAPRQATTGFVTIPSTYGGGGSSVSPGAVAGIVVGAVAGFIILVVWCLSCFGYAPRVYYGGDGGRERRRGRRGSRHHHHTHHHHHHQRRHGHRQPSVRATETVEVRTTERISRPRGGGGRVAGGDDVIVIETGQPRVAGRR